MIDLLESIRIENNSIQNANLHQERLNKSLRKLGHRSFEIAWDNIKEQNPYKKDLVKLSLTYNALGIQNLLFSKYIPRKITSLKLIVDNNIYYSLKFAERNNLNKLFEKRGEMDDILIVKNGAITDTSFTNVVFKKNNEFITPNTYLLNGIQRTYLLKTGKIKEDIIKVEDLHKFSSVLLINAMLPLEDAIEIDISQVASVL